MKKHAAAFLMVAAALFLLPSCASTQECRKSAAGDLKIGWGKRSIAMPGPVPISGQFHLRVSQGTYTPVIASALVIENSKDAVIFVSCDVVSVQPKVLILVKEILAREIKGFPVEKLIINATHTHAGPSTGANVINYPNKMKVTPGSEVQKFIARQIADAVKEAWQKRTPGAVSYGYGFATTGHSRRAVYLRDMGKKFKASAGVAVNGHGIMYGNTADPDFASYEAGTDTFINLLYTFDSKGKLSGAVINVPCPSQTSEAVWSYNASFWHNVREKLAAKYGDVGVIAQSAAAGDLAPRQLHYKAAERRRYMLKYSKLIEEYVKNPMPRPAFNGVKSSAVAADSGEVLELMRAEDIANRIVAAFDEVLSWAGKEKYSSPVLTHHVKTVKLAKRSFPKALVDDEKRKHAASMKEKFLTEGDPLTMLMHNSRLQSRRRRMAAISTRYEQVKKEPFLLTDIHAVRIGDIAFATNRFELFLDYQHRIQGRSPFEQTFIVQLTVDPRGTGSYLATARGEKNKGYSATAYSNQVSYKGGQQLVNETLKMLKALDRAAVVKKNPPVITVPKVKGIPTAKDWQKAAKAGNFCLTDGRGMQSAPTVLRLLQDGKFLYIKTECGVPAKGDKVIPPPAEEPARDGSIWQFECIEFFIGQNNECFQFIYAPGKKLTDLSHSRGTRVTGSSWNCRDLKFESALSSGGSWEAFLAIPLDELLFSAKGKAGEYRFNVFRNSFYKNAAGQIKRSAGSYIQNFGARKNLDKGATLKFSR